MAKVLAVFFGIAVCILLIAIGYYFLWPRDQGEVSIALSAPTSARVGEPFSLKVNYSNNGAKPVREAKLIVYIPEGMAFVGKSTDVRFVEQFIGDLSPGTLNNTEYMLIATNGVQTVKHIDAKIAYTSGINTNVQFESKVGADVEIGQPLVTLSFETPEKVFNGQGFEATVNYENSSDIDLDKVRLKMDYAPIFQFTKANPAPNKSNNSWDLGPLKRGEKKKVVITGGVLGSAESSFQFKASLSADFNGQTYPANVQEVNLSIAPSPLTLQPKLNQGGPEYVSKAGEFLDYVISYRNNAAVTLENVQISAVLTGEMYDFTQAKSNALFNSVTNTFVWNTANTPELAAVAPHQGGTVTLHLNTKNVYPIHRTNDKNYVLKLQAQIESQTVPDQTGGTKTVTVATLENKVAGRITVSAAGYYRDSGAGVVNSGPYPPRVNKPTQYSVHWTLKNYATDVANVRVSAFVQSNTRFIKVVKSTIGALPKFNAASGEVAWEIGNIPATGGVIGGKIEAIFQIETTPAVNQVGQVISILGPTKLEADDSFVGQKLTASDVEVTTQLPDDVTVANTEHDVKP